MPSLVVFVILSVGLAAYGADSKSLTTEHAPDVIMYLWWALGILATGAASVSTGVGVWMLKTILRHERELVEIKTHCEDRDTCEN